MTSPLSKEFKVLLDKGSVPQDSEGFIKIGDFSRTRRRQSQYLSVHFDHRSDESVPGVVENVRLQYPRIMGKWSSSIIHVDDVPVFLDRYYQHMIDMNWAFNNN